MSRLYNITFTDGTSSQEYGDSVEDVQKFCYKNKTVQSIKPQE